MPTVGHIIRPLTPTDEPFLWEMLYQAIHVQDGEPPLPRTIINEPEISRYVLHWGSEGDEGLIAIDGTTAKPIGAIWIRPFKTDNKGYGYVDDQTPEISMAVLPGHRNRGVGSALLSQLIDLVDGRYSSLSLSVSRTNPAARLYKRFGFEIIGERDGSLTMMRSLVEQNESSS